jgi:putative FmdB family regulatory protein
VPTYDYECKGCNESFQTDQKITDDPLRECPKCGGGKVSRLISSGGSFLLQGNGWYKDGYGK